jgi:plastocyanin
MNVPRVLFGVPVLLLGMFAPSAVTRPAPAPPGAVGMGHEKFSERRVTIHRGQTLRFVNDSGWLHVIGPGDEGRLKAENGAPSLGERGAFISERGDSFTTAPWNKPGTYHITCSLHPEMNITVVVTG